MQLEIQPGKSYTYSANERGAWRNDRGVEQSRAEQSRAASKHCSLTLVYVSVQTARGGVAINLTLDLHQTWLF